MQLRIDPCGQVQCVYGEAIDLTTLGVVMTQRASHVEPDNSGNWWADLAPVSGPCLGPFRHRSEALQAEAAWLNDSLFAERGSRPATPDSQRPPTTPT